MRASSLLQRYWREEVGGSEARHVRGGYGSGECSTNKPTAAECRVVGDSFCKQWPGGDGILGLATSGEGRAEGGLGLGCHKIGIFIFILP